MRLRFFIAIALCAISASAVEVRRHALLIGVNDYSASHIAASAHDAPAPERDDYPDLIGAANDASSMREMLMARYGFQAGEITILVDQKATRAAILENIRTKLIAPAQRGDIVFFYFAGHGSQVANSASDEPDLLDESIVPADSRRGALDIRDKELRRLFNTILDRGARLTVMIDACHSGSGARGLLTGAHARGVSPDLRDVADHPPYGPRPENRGALVLTASHDFDSAWETHDMQQRPHGAFTWAWMRAMRAAAPGEPAIETFLRAQATLRGETPFQDPLCAGNDAARTAPFLGARGDRSSERTIVAVQRVRSDGTVVIEGGWANGLSPGSELRLRGAATNARLLITAIEGLGRSIAHVRPSSGIMPSAIRPGALLELVGWEAPPPAPLYVSIPSTTATVRDIRGFAEAAEARAAKRSIKWIADPIATTPAHLLRRGDNGWELLGRGRTESFTTDRAALAAVSAIPRGSSLFVQLPVPAGLASSTDIEHSSVIATPRQEDAHYVLVGRFHRGLLEYAWLRPGVSRADRTKSSLPLRSVWLTQSDSEESIHENAIALHERAMRLRKIVAWNHLESPPDARRDYRICVRAPDGSTAAERLGGGEIYALELSAARTPMPRRVSKRYVYVFTIDSYGQSRLLFPPSGSIENRFPVTEAASEPFADNPPSEITLGAGSRFVVTPPYGVDTYFLLTTGEPLVNPWVLEWDGVRGERPQTPTALERLLAQTSSPSRSGGILTPPDWSIERVTLESAPRQPSKRHKGRRAVSNGSDLLAR